MSDQRQADELRPHCVQLAGDHLVDFWLDPTADNIFIAGDSAAFKRSMQLTTKHGQSVTFDGIDVIQVNDQGKIQALHAYWDPAPVLAVLRGEPG